MTQEKADQIVAEIREVLSRHDAVIYAPHSYTMRIVDRTDAWTSMDRDVRYIGPPMDDCADVESIWPKDGVVA